MILSLQNVFLFICLLASVTIYFHPGSPLYLRLFPVYLLIGLIGNTIISYLGIHHTNNLWLANGLTLLESVFYFFILREIIKNKKVKEVILHIMWIYPLLALFNMFFIQRSTFHSMTYALSCLLLTGICIYYFIELFQLPQTSSLLRESEFWLCTGILFSSCLTFPFYGFIAYLHDLPRVLIKSLQTIIMIINILTFILFTIAFLCRIRIRKSIL